VRIIDKQTGLRAISQEHRSKDQNIKTAFRRLVKKLIDHYKDQANITQERNTQTTRTYHSADNRVVDHITGQKYSYRQTIGNGDIGQIIEDRIRYQLTQSKVQ
jgi:protein subunit release factor A